MFAALGVLHRCKRATETMEPQLRKSRKEGRGWVNGKHVQERGKERAHVRVAGRESKGWKEIINGVFYVRDR